MPLIPLLLLLVAVLMAVNAVAPPTASRGVGMVEVTKVHPASP